MTDSAHSRPALTSNSTTLRATLPLVVTFAFTAFITIYYVFIVDVSRPLVAYGVVVALWLAWVAALLLTLRGRNSARARRAILTLSGFCVAVGTASFYLVR